MYMENILYLLLKRKLKKQTKIKNICYGITPIVGSSAGYRKKRSRDRMTDSHWV